MNNPKKLFEELNKLDYRTTIYRLKKSGYSVSLIKRMQREGLRFLALCAMGKKCAPSFLIDEWWHAMILNTKQYAGPVTSVCGMFIHHSPNGGTKKEKLRDLKFFWNAVDEYESFFGKPDLLVWGLEEKFLMEVK